MNNIYQMVLAFALMSFFGANSVMASVNTDIALVEVLHTIEDDYRVVFSYNAQDVKHITVHFERNLEESFEVAINRALSGTGLKYKSVGLNFYIIYKKNKLNERRLGQIKEKIEEIRSIAKGDDFIISDTQSLSSSTSLLNENTIKGQILSDSGEPLAGASIIVVGSTHGTASDTNGFFELKIPSSSGQLAISYTGYSSEKVDITDQRTIRVRLKEGLELKGVTLIGSRGLSRTQFDSPVPVDHFTIEALNSTGKFSLDEQLNEVAPSLTSGQHPVSDATAHFNPVDLRGLLPSRTLVLVNGKRKNASALLYSYVTASRGEVGVDLKSIGADAVAGVEILRDGAAAQYGSDAIAGVINLQLKEKIKPFLNVATSSSGQLDGTQLQLSSGFSFDIFEKGFASFTLGYLKQSRSQRAGVITSETDEAAYWGTSIFSEEEFRSYLDVNPRAGFQVGLPDISALNASFNIGYTINKETDTKAYAFGTMMNRSGRSPQFARGPYWVTGFESIYPNQDFFLPEMAPKIGDHMMVAGLTHNLAKWELDLSSTFGHSRIDYFIENSFNQSLGAESPKDFYNGAHRFSHLVNNLDVNRTFKPAGIKQISLAFGMEQRLELFNGFAGEFASYGDGTPEVLDRIGSESFSGLSPADAVQGKRNNIGFYTEVDSDLSENVQLGAAARFERYSDFGNNMSWKVNGLYKIIPTKLNFRMAVSNGFRAPSLHQIYYTSTTTTLTPEGVVQNRILNNLDPALRILNIPKLTPETSLNLSYGAVYNLSNKISLSFDAYWIKLKDRIVLSGQLGMQEQMSSPINELLQYTNTSSAGFFLNAVNTATQGLDFVISYKDVQLGKGKLEGSLSANINKTEVTDIKLPSFIEGNDLRDEVFSREDVSRLETWRPQQKVMLSTTYSIADLAVTMGLNYFGAVTYRHPEDPTDDAVFGGKYITNATISYYFNSKLKCQIGVNNLFNVYPDSFSQAFNGTPNDRNLDFVGRFQYPWQTLQIGIDGIRGFTKLTYNL